MPWNGWDQLSPTLILANFWDAAQRGGGFGPRYIAQFQILIVQSGRGTARVGDHRFDLGPGDLVYYGPNVQHAVATHSEQMLQLIGIAFLFQQDDVARLPGEGHAGTAPWQFPEGPPRCPLDPQPPALLRSGPGSGVRRTCEAIALSFLGSPRDRALEKRGLLLMLFEQMHDAMASQAMQPAVPTTHRRAIVAAQQAILSRLASPPGLAELARPAGLQPSYFARLFKQHTGLSVRGFTNEQRLLRARRLLVEGRLSIDQIAASVGYRDPFYFSRLFRRQFGFPPSRMRLQRVLA